jgi:hypothetical protein
VKVTGDVVFNCPGIKTDTVSVRQFRRLMVRPSPLGTSITGPTVQGTGASGQVPVSVTYPHMETGIIVSGGVHSPSTAAKLTVNAKEGLASKVNASSVRNDILNIFSVFL